MESNEDELRLKLALYALPLLGNTSLLTKHPRTTPSRRVSNPLRASSYYPVIKGFANSTSIGELVNRQLRAEDLMIHHLPLVARIPDLGVIT